MLVSFVIVALNAAETLPILLLDLKKQDYDHSKIEVLLVDGGSNDKTKEIMEEFCINGGFNSIRVLDNPGRTLACGWNVALDNLRGDVVLRVDAHASIPANFVSESVSCIQSGESICGGKVRSISYSESGWNKVLLFAENSAFGGGIAPFRRSEEEKYVKTLAFATYKREVFERVGRYDERLVRTEDNEMHYRMRKCGYKFRMDPKIESTRVTRSSFWGLIKQKYGNGFWIGLTMFVSPRCFSVYHFAPLIFFVAIVISLGLMCVGFTGPGYALGTVYCMFALVSTVSIAINEGFFLHLLALPFVYFVMHVSYGLGTFIGLLKGPFWIRHNPS